MDDELREIEALTRELFSVLEGFWSECQMSTFGKAEFIFEEQGPEF